MASFWQYKLFADIQRLFSENCHQTGVWWLKSTNLQFFRCYIVISFRNKVGIVKYHNTASGFLPTLIRMTLNDRECPLPNST